MLERESLNRYTGGPHLVKAHLDLCTRASHFLHEIAKPAADHLPAVNYIG